jgi:uncharacterized membrane protein YciS (DUF1049 family)
MLLFLFGSGFGLVIFWVVCAWFIERSKLKAAAREGISKDEYYRRQLERWKV